MTKEYFNAIKKESKNLRTILTDEQKAKLNGKTLDRVEHCVYAQLFGTSIFPDAKDLKMKVTKVRANYWDSPEVSDMPSFERDDMTPLESYLFIFGPVNVARYILPYIKGERKQFVAQKFLQK